MKVMHEQLSGSKIKRRISVIRAMIVSFFVVTVIMIGLSIATFKTIRTFVYGESMWTRSQILASYSLTQYLETRNEEHYQNFLSHLKIIEADEAGLIEILDKDTVTTKAIDHIEQGMNDRRDLEVALRVFSFLIQFPITQDMIHEWQIGNSLTRELKTLGSRIHQDYLQNVQYSKEQKDNMLAEIHDNNARLNRHELRFSQPLVDLAREVENLLGLLHLFLFLLISMLGIYIYFSTAQIFQRSLQTIKNSILDAVSGNVNQQILIPAEEDIFDISSHLNWMYASFEKQLKGRLSAEESEARLAILADAMPQIVCIYDSKYQVEFLNKNGREYFGVSAEDIKQVNMIHFCHDEEKSRALRQREQGTITKAPGEIEVRLKNTQNIYQWFLCRFEPVLNDNNEIIRWYSSFTNIQGQKAHALELEKSVAIRDQFLSIASHELRTPLTALKLQIGMRQRLIDKKLIDHVDLNYFQKNIIDDNKQIDRIIRLVDDMLDISRIKAGKLSYDFSEIEVNQFINEVVQRFLPEFNEKKCQLIFEPISETICFWDSHRIEQVMINLLSNALKYGRNKDVLIKLEKQFDQIAIKVIDQGEGIDSENKEKIFELFERANKDQAISGLGLGLYIVKQIVQSHHGRIDIFSEFDKGSTFVITLPIRVEIETEAEKISS